MRFFLAAAFLSLAACGGPSPTKSDQPPPEAVTPKPTATPPDAAALPSTTPGGRVGTINLQCGGDTIRVVFEDARAIMVNDDGSNTDLAKLPADTNSTPGVDVFSDGKVTVTHHVANDGSLVAKFARGKMALKDCATVPN